MNRKARSYGGRLELNDDLIKRFWWKVNKTNDCWLWEGALTDKGRGTTGIGGGITRPAHRVAYELMIGPIPEGLEIDHLCRVPRCVNPSHLEPVTHAENIRRGPKPKQDECKRGHPISGYNEFILAEGRGRRCRKCSNLLTQRSYWKKKGVDFPI